jgi:hypothetical protein
MDYYNISNMSNNRINIPLIYFVIFYWYHYNNCLFEKNHCFKYDQITANISKISIYVDKI